MANVLLKLYKDSRLMKKLRGCVSGRGSAIGGEGFTLIELMIVVSIIGILAAIAVPNYQWGIIRAKEAVLRENLYNIHSSIDQFEADQGKCLGTLQELVDKKYLPSIPVDPFTKSNETWQTMKAIDPGTTGEETLGDCIERVHSGSDLIGSDGTAYNTW